MVVAVAVAVVVAMAVNSRGAPARGCRPQVSGSVAGVPFHSSPSSSVYLWRTPAPQMRTDTGWWASI